MIYTVMQGKLPYFMAPPRGEGETEDDGDDEEVEDEQGRDDDGDDDEVTVTSTHFGNVLVLRVGLGAT